MAFGNSTPDGSGTWTSWNIVYADSGTNATTSTETWGGWNGVYSASTTSSGVTWSAWCSNDYAVTVNGFNYQPRELTADERAAETERLRAEADAARLRQEEARRACEKAEALLQAHLDEEQQAMLQREQAFLVSVKSGRKYKVKRGQRGNVHELDEQGQAVRQFCIHPDDVPDQDAMLAQKLLLEHDEPAFRRIANITELRRAS